MIKLQEVIHFYLGCECQLNNGERYILKPSNLPSNWSKVEHPHKLILRKLSDMTIAEMKDWAALNNYDLSNEGCSAEDVHKELTDGLRKRGLSFLKINAGEFEVVQRFFVFFLKRGFDLFGLIESGQAIDASTEKK